MEENLTIYIKILKHSIPFNPIIPSIGQQDDQLLTASRSQSPHKAENNHRFMVVRVVGLVSLLNKCLLIYREIRSTMTSL